MGLDAATSCPEGHGPFSFHSIISTISGSFYCLARISAAESIRVTPLPSAWMSGVLSAMAILRHTPLWILGSAMGSGLPPDCTLHPDRPNFLDFLLLLGALSPWSTWTPLSLTNWHQCDLLISAFPTCNIIDEFSETMSSVWVSTETISAAFLGCPAGMLPWSPSAVLKSLCMVCD